MVKFMCLLIFDERDCSILLVPIHDDNLCASYGKYTRKNDVGKLSFCFGIFSFTAKAKNAPTCGRG